MRVRIVVIVVRVIRIMYILCCIVFMLVKCGWKVIVRRNFVRIWVFVCMI